MGTIQQKFTGDAAQLEAEYAKILQQQIKLEEQLNKTKKAADNAAEGQDDFLHKIAKGGPEAVQSLAAIAVGYASVSTAIDGVLEGMRAQHELEAKSLRTAISKADAEAQVAINMGDTAPEEFQGFLGRVSEIQKATGFQSEIPLMMAAATTLSAVASDTERTADTLQTLAPIFKSAPDDLAEVAQVVGSLGKMTESNAKETTGLVLSTMGQARVTSLSAFKNVGPALAGSIATQKGVDPKVAAREAAAAFAGIGSLIDDAEGAQTRTAVANLSVDLEKAFPGNLSFAQRLDMAQDMGDKIQSAISKGRAPDAEMVAKLTDITSSGFEGAVKPVIKELVSGNDNRAARGFDAALAKIGFDGGFTDRLTNRLQGGTLNLELANRQRQFEGTIERGLSDPGSQIRASSTSVFENAMGNIGRPGWYQTWMSYQGQLTGLFNTREENYLRVLRDEERRFRGIGAREGDPVPENVKSQVTILRDAMQSIQQNIERNQRRQGAALQMRQQQEGD